MNITSFSRDIINSITILLDIDSLKSLRATCSFFRKFIIFTGEYHKHELAVPANTYYMDLTNPNIILPKKLKALTIPDFISLSNYVIPKSVETIYLDFIDYHDVYDVDNIDILDVKNLHIIDYNINGFERVNISYFEYIENLHIYSPEHLLLPTCLKNIYCVDFIYKKIKLEYLECKKIKTPADSFIDCIKILSSKKTKLVKIPLFKKLIVPINIEVEFMNNSINYRKIIENDTVVYFA